MASRTFNPAGASDNWSTAAAWGGTVPQDGDSFTIAAGKTCLFDVDQSGMATGMVAGTINGTLGLTTTAGTYYLKMDGVSGHNIALATANSVLDWTNGGNAVATNVTATISLGAASKITSANAAAYMRAKSTFPTHRFCRMTADAGANPATSITIDTDWSVLSAEGWAIGDTVAIVSKWVSSFVWTKATIAAGTSGTTMNLTGASSAALLNGAYVVRVTSNVTITYAGTQAALLDFTKSGSGTPRSEVGCTVHQTSGAGGNLTAFGGALLSGVFMLNGTSLALNSWFAEMSGTFIRCNLNNTHSITASGMFLACGSMDPAGEWHITPASVWYGCDSWAGFGVFSGSIKGSNRGYAINAMRGAVLTKEANIGGTGNDANGYDVAWQFGMTVDGYGTILQSTNQFTSGYQAVYNDENMNHGLTLWDVASSYGNPQPGFIKASRRGGDMDTITSAWPANPPVTPPYCYKVSFASWRGQGGLPFVFEVPFRVEAETPVRIVVYAAMGVAPLTANGKFSIVDPAYRATDAAGYLATSGLMASNTNWQTFTLDYMPTAGRELRLRVEAENANNYLYWFYKIVQGAKVAVGMR